jgi:hypothetical protein
MKRIYGALISTVVAVAIGIPAVALADDSGFYVGAMGGVSDYKDVSISNIAGPLPSNGPISGTTTSSISKVEGVWGAAIGWQFMKYMAVEGSYIDLRPRESQPPATIPSTAAHRRR